MGSPDANVRCPVCGETFSPKGLPIHMGRRHGEAGRARRMRDAIRDMVAMMPPERFALLRPETNETIDRVCGAPVRMAAAPRFRVSGAIEESHEENGVLVIDKVRLQEVSLEARRG